MRTVVIGCCLVLGIVVAGCGKKSDRVTVYPVQGKVMAGGQPAAGARIVFYPSVEQVDGLPMPTPAATADANGVFQLESYEPGDGAPAGDYRVTIVWPEPPPANADGIFDIKDRLGNRYSNPDTSKLTAKIEEGGGEVPAFQVQ